MERPFDSVPFKTPDQHFAHMGFVEFPRIAVRIHNHDASDCGTGLGVLRYQLRNPLSRAIFDAYGFRVLPVGHRGPDSCAILTTSTSDLQSNRQTHPALTADEYRPILVQDAFAEESFRGAPRWLKLLSCAMAVVIPTGSQNAPSPTSPTLMGCCVVAE